MANIKDLLKAGLVQDGTELIWNRRVAKQKHTATINSKGTITTADGLVHKTPSGAAKHLNSNKPIDGWNAWKLKEGGNSLSELRSKLVN
jgi:hypothetical protein